MFDAVAIFLGINILVDLAVRAIEHAHQSEKQACCDMGLAPSQWSRQKADIEHVSLQRLSRLSNSVLQWFFALGSMHYGLPVELQRATALRLGQKRMAQCVDERKEQTA